MVPIRISMPYLGWFLGDQISSVPRLAIVDWLRVSPGRGQCLLEAVPHATAQKQVADYGGGLGGIQAGGEGREGGREGEGGRGIKRKRGRGRGGEGEVGEGGREGERGKRKGVDKIISCIIMTTTKVTYWKKTCCSTAFFQTLLAWGRGPV